METKELKVSTETQGFLECMHSLDKQWIRVNNALTDIYGGSQASSIMDRGYNEAHEKLRGVISTYLLDSINDKMTNMDFEEI